MSEKKYWWVSIEQGCGMSRCPVPATKEKIRQIWANLAWAEQAFGLPTEAEQLRLQDIAINSPIAAVEEEFSALLPRVPSGECAFIPGSELWFAEGQAKKEGKGK